MIDKMIHGNEFRLRVLMTNECNKNCRFCLNDFQKKGKDYVRFMEVIDCIRAYGQFMKSIGEKSVITFSGGEPGLHAHLNLILSHAKQYCDVVKVVTNGMAFTRAHHHYVDRFHISAYGFNSEIFEYRKICDRITVQTVITDDMPLGYIRDLVQYYKNADVPVKLFADFFSKDRQSLFDKINQVEGVCTRFTGKQINRGPACAGCEKDCVTLKALWYFPDDTSSTCPQGYAPKFDDDTWDETVEKAYNLHKM